MKRSPWFIGERFFVAFMKRIDTINRNMSAENEDGLVSAIPVKGQEFNMISKKSPCGANFPYYYKDGALFGAHYEGFTRREKELLERMRAEEEFIIQQHYPLPYWVNFYGTKLTPEVMSEFIQSMNRLQRYIPKLAIVGCSFFDQWRLKQVVKKLGMSIPVRYFSDTEAAKTWLVTEVD